MRIIRSNLEKYSTGTYTDTEIFWRAGELNSNVLKNFPYLTKLDCECNKLTSLKGIEVCTQLQKLICSRNRLVSLKGIESCTQLETLDCSYNRLVSLKGLESCNRLIKLDCHTNKLANLKGLETCIQLKTLYCHKNKLVSLEGLDACIQLLTLDCSNNKIANLKGLQGCIQLLTLDCYCNNLTSLEGLESCSNLQTLYCYCNNLASLEGLESCVQLQELGCHSSKLVSLKGIERCTQLQILECSSNKLTTLKELESCTRLQMLACPDNEITNLQPLIYLPNLEHLSYSSNPLNPPTIQERRFLNRLKRVNAGTSVYSDNQNVHNTTIQKSVCNSVRNLLNDPKPNKVNIDQLDVQLQTKELLKSYCKDKTEHSILLITYQELLNYVVQRLTTTEMLKVFEQEILDSKDLCFTGRFNRSVNALAGFYPDIEIQISDSDRLSAIILQIKETELPKNQQAKAIQILKELGYDEQIIEIWTNDLVN